jgi:hypothetical protein
VSLARAPEAASALAARLGLRYEDGGSFLLLADGATRVRIFPNTHRIALDGEERTLRGYFARGPQGVSVPGPAAGIIEEHVGAARARVRAQALPVAPVPRPAPKAVVAAPPLALPKPLPKAPVPAPAATAPRAQGDATWEVGSGARAWKWIVLHHSDDTSGNLAKYHQGHLDKGWEHGCGYHFVIGNGSLSRDGEVEVSQRWTRQLHGAHAKTPDNRYNDFGVGIVLVGDFERGSGRPTQAQMRSLVRLTQWLMDRFGIPAANVKGHCDCKATCCPGRNFPWAELRSKLRAPPQQKVAALPGTIACAPHGPCDGDCEHAQAPKVAAVPSAAAPAASAWLPGAAPASGGAAPGPRALPVPPPLGVAPPSGALPAQR